MAEQHRATAEQWQGVKEHNDLTVFSCLLELRDRIEALETPQSGSVDLSHLSDAEREKMARWIANPDRFEVLEVAQPAKPNHPEKPDSSLVERVAFAITGDSDGLINWKPEARAAIRAVAAWMTNNPDHHFPPALVFALEQEAEL